MAASSRRVKSSGTSDADKYSSAIRDIQTTGSGENKKCFECQQRGPTYVDITIGSFVCTKCSGMLRGITPPHRIKSISMSSFSADEVELMRERGNAYCAKVWLGLYDGKTIENDAESIKDFIMQKYEKKRYYVDPSTIRHSLGSTASTSSSISQQSDGFNLVPLGSSINSANITSKGSDMIGTTLQLQLNSKKQNNIITHALPASSRNAPAMNVPSNSGFSALSTSLPQSSATDAKAKSSNFSNMTGTMNITQNNLNQQSLSSYALPAPSKDPFAPSRIDKVIRTSNSGFSGVSLPMPTVGNSTNKSSAVNGKSNIMNQSFQTEQRSKKFTADFANFDQASFGDRNDSNTNGDLSKIAFASTEQKNSIEIQKTSDDTAGDRYAALKDLDDMFKTTVMSESGTNSNKASTGAAIFGSSPVPSNPVMPPTFGQPAERETSTPTSISKVQGVQPNEDNFKVSQPNTSGWAELWPQESKRNINANSMKNEASSYKLTSTMKNMEDTQTSESSNLPINPFTGTSNLTQLNTSPWPTTGSSPIQSTDHFNWPPNAKRNGKESDDFFQTQPIEKEPEISTGTSKFSNFADFGNVNTSSNEPNKAAFGTFPDPFGAAPNNNLSQQSDKTTDLFANAPKPAFHQGNDIDKTIGILTSEIFGNANGTQKQSNDKNNEQFDFGIDPWANSNADKELEKTITPSFGWHQSSNGNTVKQPDVTNSLFTSTSTVLQASKSTNPFL